MASTLALIEFPADDAERARSFWSGLLGTTLEPRTSAQGEGWQTPASRSETDTGAPSGASSPAPAVGVHARGRGPGDSFSLPYFEVDDIEATLAQVPSLGGSIVHPGDRWAICKDSEGNPFALARRVSADAANPDGADAASVVGADAASDDLHPSRP
jgi:predicted enzyme related to lactoylglutathione lyase